MENLRNIVILKDLPSNVIEQAFVVLKKNQKVKKFDHIENGNNFIQEKSGELDDDFIIKEAELLIENYIDNNTKCLNGNVGSRLEKKCKRLKKLVGLLSFCLFCTIIYILF